MTRKTTTKNLCRIFSFIPLLMVLTFTITFSFLQNGHTQSPTPTATEIVRRADEIRNPGESYRMQVSVTSGEGERSVFEVALNGPSQTFIKTLEPARDRGRNMLMRGEEMWAYVPNLKRAIRVSLSQKLTGQAANGDISRMRWAGDYSAKTESEDAGAWQLLLSANKKGLTYDKIRVWVNKKDFHPMKAEFLTPQAKLLKRVEYADYRPNLGKTRPHLMKIQDAVRPDDRSEIRVLEMEVKTFPAAMFNQNNLR